MIIYIIDYKKAYKDVKFINEIQEIKHIISCVIDKFESRAWIDEFEKLSWSQIQNKGDVELSFYKNDVFVRLSDQKKLLDWLVTIKEICESKSINLCVLIVEATRSFLYRNIDEFEKILNSKLFDLNLPFVIILVAEGRDEPKVKLFSIEEKVVSILNRSIEFPPMYCQAGLGILNYFNSYIQKKYPHEDVTVTIEQYEKTVKLVIETENGNKEVIEKALEEYMLIVTGKQKP